MSEKRLVPYGLESQLLKIHELLTEAGVPHNHDGIPRMLLDRVNDVMADRKSLQRIADAAREFRKQAWDYAMNANASTFMEAVEKFDAALSAAPQQEAKGE